ncbi:MAG: hypothetical protein GEU93_13515 [Propionibacteriales bacterium]|nr:hypothetical protein [Propionibacteriales bacterium]
MMQSQRTRQVVVIAICVLVAMGFVASTLLSGGGQDPDPESSGTADAPCSAALPSGPAAVVDPRQPRLDYVLAAQVDPADVEATLILREIGAGKPGAQGSARAGSVADHRMSFDLAAQDLSEGELYSYRIETRVGDAECSTAEAGTPLGFYVTSMSPREARSLPKKRTRDLDQAVAAVYLYAAAWRQPGEATPGAKDVCGLFEPPTPCDWAPHVEGQAHQ